MNKILFYISIGLLSILIGVSSSKDSFTQITPTLLNLVQCKPYAYGDFNADKLIDIFCLKNTSNEIEIWLAQDTFKDSLFIKYKYLKLNDSETIVNLIPGDYNGDSVIDLMVIYRNSTNDHLSVRVYFGNKTSKNENDISENNMKDYLYKFFDQPLVTDLNGDGISDLIGQDKSNGRCYYYFDNKGNLKQKQQIGDNLNKDLLVGYANSVVDLDNDYSPDLVLISENNSKPLFEVWKLDKEGEYVYSYNYTTPPDAVYFGQSIFADFDSDGIFEHLLPVCKDLNCHNSSIYIYKNLKWIDLPIDIGQYTYQVVKTLKFDNNIGISFKIGDYNLDGYIDLLAVMKNSADSTDSSSQYAVVLKNINCNDLAKCNGISRTFKIDINTNEALSTVNNVRLASFFDINDDGSLDILILVKDTLLAYKNELYDDVYFLKVMVIPGRCDCSYDCPSGTLPYGLNYPTPFIQIESESFEYKTFKLYASQLSQSSHLSLQLPYVIFGLGSTPNFVDRLTVGVYVSEMKQVLKRDWPSIIPNSQLVINVNPRNSIQYWKLQLFLTPSKNILFTGISLGSTMVCLIIVIIFLQYREKKIDEKERKLESQRFHFDGL